ncbi:ion transporter, partial [Candidatus Woesearchaeota archaeon]|nr:ion transporter [Candidatus Woesearchaeota archaeon]
MDIYKRLGLYFFTFGALLSILAGAFKLGEGMHDLVLVILIFLGVFSAILNIDEEEEMGFLIASSSFLIAIITFDIVLASHPLVLLLARFFEVSTFFIGSMVAVVGLKTIIEFGSMNTTRDPLKHADEVDDSIEALMFSPAERFWNIMVFIAVAVSFIAVLLEVFFEPILFAVLFVLIDAVITVVFLIDLFVLYRKENGLVSFLKNCWLDIVATIPLSYLFGFQHLSLFRAAKLVRLIRLQKFLKLNRTLKLMSKKSGVRHYVRGELRGIQERRANEQPRRAETERSTKTSARTLPLEKVELEQEPNPKRKP